MKTVRNLVFLLRLWASMEAQLVKNSPAMQETWVPSLGWDEVHRLYSPWGRKDSDTAERLSL